MIAYLTSLATTIANRGGARAKKFARTAGLIAVAAAFGSVALGFATAGAYMVLRTSYDTVVVVFIIGGVYAAAAILILLYVVLGGHEVARAAHAPPDEVDSAQATLSGLAAGTGSERDRLALLAGAQLARGLKPMHLLALSFLAGVLSSQRRKQN